MITTTRIGLLSIGAAALIGATTMHNPAPMSAGCTTDTACESMYGQRIILNMLDRLCVAGRVAYCEAQIPADGDDDRQDWSGDDDSSGDAPATIDNVSNPFRLGGSGPLRSL